MAPHQALPIGGGPHDREKPCTRRDRDTPPPLVPIAPRHFDSDQSSIRFLDANAGHDTKIRAQGGFPESPAGYIMISCYKKMTDCLT